MKGAGGRGGPPRQAPVPPYFTVTKRSGKVSSES